MVVATLDKNLECFVVRTKHLIKFVFCLVEPDAGQDLPFKKTKFLRQHKETKPEAIRYPCDQADYAATKASHLKKHKEFKHDGMRYLYDNCEYSVVNILLHFAIFSVESSLPFSYLPYPFPSLLFSHPICFNSFLSFPFPSSPLDFLSFQLGPSLLPLSFFPPI